jgi:hypothetical protein
MALWFRTLKMLAAFFGRTPLALLSLNHARIQSYRRVLGRMAGHENLKGN